MKQLNLLNIFAAIGLLLGARAVKAADITNPEAPITYMELIEISAQEIDGFVADWNKRLEPIGQMPGYMNATLYRSLLAEAQYQLIAITQWQSYEAWSTANNSFPQDTNIKRTGGFYRPTAWSNNTYAETFHDRAENPSIYNGKPLDRARKDPEIKFPERPFVFINLMEMNADDIAPFVSDWRIRSEIMGQMPAAMGSTLYRSVLSDNPFPIVNVSQWQTYDGFIDANNNPTYAQKLESDLAHTSSIKLTRRFYRPVATYTHIYGDTHENK